MAGGAASAGPAAVAASGPSPVLAQQETVFPGVGAAVCVSWTDAQVYVRWLTAETGARYRLPSEAEWEYGARANTRTERYWDGASGSLCDHANAGDRGLLRRGWPLAVVNCAAHTAPVGSYGANAFGLHGVLGNVWEWTADCWHDDYQGAPDDASAWTRRGDCDRRVHRVATRPSLDRGRPVGMRRRARLDAAIS